MLKMDVIQTHMPMNIDNMETAFFPEVTHWLNQYLLNSKILPSN